MPDLSNLAVGTLVTIFSGGGWGPPQVRKSKIVEVTKAGNYRFEGSDRIWTKTGGYRGQGTWDRENFDVFDQAVWDDIKEQHQERKDRHRVENYEWRKAPIELIRAVIAVLPAEPKKENA